MRAAVTAKTVMMCFMLLDVAERPSEIRLDLSFFFLQHSQETGNPAADSRENKTTPCSHLLFNKPS